MYSLKHTFGGFYLFFSIPISTVIKRSCVTEQLTHRQTHTLNTKTKKQKEKLGFPFKMYNVDALSKVSKVIKSVLSCAKSE